MNTSVICEVTTYNCTTTLFNHKIGKYSEKDKTPVNETYEWQVGENDNGKPVLVLDKGQGAMTFKREEK